MAPPRKRQKTSSVPEITFDFASREEYLTGFHKRKQARIRHAQELAAKKEREERIRERRELREQRKKDLEEHVEAMNAALRKAIEDLSDGEGSNERDEEDGSEEEWKGFDESTIVNHEDEYIDEDKYTTVTVEAVDITRDGFVNPDTSSEHEDGTAIDKTNNSGNEGRSAGKSKDSGGKRAWTKEKPIGDRSKKKRKKFRYETKAERKLTRAKEKAKNRAKAKARRGE